MFKSVIKFILVIFTVSLLGCSIGVGGLQSYVDTSNGYQFLYPNGWVGVDLKSLPTGVDIAYQDLIDPSENLSVIISDVDQQKNLTDLGNPLEVGDRFMKKVNNNPDSKLSAELINAELREDKDRKYYILEYAVKNDNNNQLRHNVASIVVNKGKLYTFNISIPESRWLPVKKLFTIAAKSFSIS